MLPKLEKVGLGWATFQVLRKTNASLSKKAGVDPKVASDQRGHGLGVSMEHYTFEQFVNEVYVPFCQRRGRRRFKGLRFHRSCSLSLPIYCMKLPRKHHPAIEGGRALLATITGLDSHRVRGAFDHVAQADFFFQDETGKAHSMSGVRSLFGRRSFFGWSSRGLFFLFHNGFLPLAFGT